MLTTTKRFLSNACAAAAVFALAAALWHVPKAQAQTIGQKGDNPIVIKQSATTDNITYLMAAAASRPSTTSVHYSSNSFRPKHFWLKSISSSESLEWTVSTTTGESFHITTLLHTQQANQSFRLEVTGATGANRRLNYTVASTGWQRHNSGTIFIPAGTSTLRFTRTSNGGDLALKSLELLATADKAAYDARVAAFKGNANTFSNYDYGLMYQYGAWGYPQTGAAKSLDQQAQDFNVPNFVAKVKELGADYVIWSATWWTYEFNAPVTAVDNLISSDRTSTRDLIGDIATALDREGIGFFLYYHTGQDGHLGYNSTDWWKAQSFPDEFTTSGTGNRTTFFNNWVSVITELGNRYGKKLDGWFFDDGLVYYPAPFERLGKAAKAGNPHRLISYNPWLVARYTDFEDLSFGEECKSEGAPAGGNGLYTSGGDAGLYGHCMYKMENDWGIKRQNESISAHGNRSAQDLINTTKKHRALKTPISWNLMLWEDGSISLPASETALKGLQAALKPNIPTRINDDNASIVKTGAWLSSSNRGAGDYNDDVSYTGANGDSLEYTFIGTGVTVIGPKGSDQGNLEIFIDNISRGTISTYANAYTPQQRYFVTTGLTPDQHTVKVVKRSGDWMQVDAIDTIPFARTATVNDNDVDITKTGAWLSSSNRGAGDYSDDVSYTGANGDSLEYTFTGTGVKIIGPKGSDQGNVEIFIDNISQGTISTYANAYAAQQRYFVATGLTPSQHTVKVVKRSGDWMQLDAIEITPLVSALLNDNDVEITKTGAWLSSSNRGAGDYNNDVSYTGANGDSLEYTFTGTGVKIIGPKGSDQGNVEIFIDNVSKGTVNTYAATYAAQQEYFSDSSLSAGKHTVKIVKRSGAWMQLDAIEITPLVSVLLNDDDGMIIKRGAWARSTGRGAGNHGDDVSTTAANDAWFEYTFTGAGIDIIGEKGPSLGNFEVFIDGVSKGVFSANATTRQVRQSLYSISYPASGFHTVKVVKKSGTSMLLDALRVTRTAATPTTPTVIIASPARHNGSAFTATLTFSRPVTLDCCIHQTQGAITSTFTFSKPVTGFNAVGDITVTGARILTFSGAGATYTATIRPNNIVGEDDNADIQYFANVALKVAGGAVANDTTAIVRFDGIRPTVNIAAPATHNGSAFVTTFTFSETVTGFTADDIGVRGGSVSNLTGTGRLYTATITPTDGDTNVRLWLNASSVEDVAGNGNSATGRTIRADTAP